MPAGHTDRRFRVPWCGDNLRLFGESGRRGDGNHKYRLPDGICHYRYFAGRDLPEWKIVHVTAMPAMVGLERE